MHQLELFEKRIKITECSLEGHDIHYVDSEDVMKFVNNKCDEFGYRVYVDSHCVDPKKLDISTLSYAKRIMLVTAVVGG
jgi:hypothetical protein